MEEISTSNSLLVHYFPHHVCVADWNSNSFITLCVRINFPRFGSNSSHNPANWTQIIIHGSSVGKRGVIFLTVVLSIFFIAKLSRISPYADYLIRASQALNQVVIPYRAPIILSEQENNRLHYYSKLPINHFTFSTGSKNLVDTLRKEVEYYSGCADAVIFCVRVEKEQLLEFQKTDAKIVFQSYTNRQREKVFAIILFSNLPALNIEQICRNSSEIDTPNVIWTESFSTGVKNNPNTPHNRLLAGRRLFFFRTLISFCRKIGALTVTIEKRIPLKVRRNMN